MELPSLVGYLDTGLAFLVALAVLGIGLGLVRPVHAGAGYMVGAAGGLKLLSTCCMQASSMAVDSVGYVAVTISQVVLIGEHVLFWGLIAFAAYSVASGKGGPRGVA